MLQVDSLPPHNGFLKSNHHFIIIGTWLIHLNAEQHCTLQWIFQHVISQLAMCQHIISQHEKRRMFKASDSYYRTDAIDMLFGWLFSGFESDLDTTFSIHIHYKIFQSLKYPCISQLTLNPDFGWVNYLGFRRDVGARNSYPMYTAWACHMVDTVPIRGVILYPINGVLYSIRFSSLSSK